MKVVLAIAALGLSVVGASACDFMRSAQVDTTIVASVTPAEQAVSMSTADTTVLAPAEQKPVIEESVE